MGDDADGDKADDGVSDDRLAKLEEENRYDIWGMGKDQKFQQGTGLRPGWG